MKRMSIESTMKYLALVGCIGVAACGQNHSQPAQSKTSDVQTTATRNAPKTRGSTAPSAPVQLTYQLPADIAANQPTTVDIAITTRLNSGNMRVEIAGHEGVTVLSDTQYRFDLGAISARPIPLQLKVLPADQAERFLAILITVDTEMGAMARSFRIDLQPTSPTPTIENKRLIQQ